MIRTLDATILNRIAAHPEVRPWLGGTQVIDLTALAGDIENFCFLTDSGKGGYIYHRKAAALYEVHTLSLPDGRGRELLKARDESLAAMFLKTDALEIQTMVPDGNTGADRWSAHAGFREMFRREGSFDLMGSRVGASYRSLGHADWVMLDPANQKAGKGFHAWLHEIVPDDHGEDPIHDAWVGATIRAIQEGNGVKAIALYNRWALQANYETISLKTLNPLCIDIRSALLQYDSAGLSLLSCTARSAPVLEDQSAPCLSESESRLLA